jgi:phosphatidylinositol glycan class W
MMLMTALCILAVDFPVYPRELAKCETFGTGLVSHSY